MNNINIEFGMSTDIMIGKVAQSTTIKAAKNTLSPMVIGYIAITAALFIWSGFSLTVRAIDASPLATADVALIRFIVPLILLLPLLPSRLEKIKRVRVFDLFLIMLGGLPFLFFAALCAKMAPAAYMGAILAGTLAFFFAILSCCYYRQVITKKQLLTLTLIIGGILVMIMGQPGDISGTTMQCIAFLLCGSFVWAVYTMGIQRSGIDAITIAIILSASSLFVTLVLIMSDLVTSNFGSFSLLEACHLFWFKD